MNPNNIIYGWHTLIKITGMNRCMIQQHMAYRNFPRPIENSARYRPIRWDRTAVTTWLELNKNVMKVKRKQISVYTKILG